MKTPIKNPIVISNPCVLACVLAVRNLLSKYHVPLRFLDSPFSRFPRNDSNVFRRFGLAELTFLPQELIESNPSSSPSSSASLERKLAGGDLCCDSTN